VLTTINYIPEGLLSVNAQALHQVLEGPTLIHLAGERAPPLFLSILAHGNEDVGLLVLQQLLKKYQNQPLPRSLSIFIGNISAAKENVRRLAGQPDYNRVWSLMGGGQTAEHQMMQQVIEDMQRRGVFASIDLHNNTGRNPFYACVNRLGAEFLQLAGMFSRTIVYFIRPNTVQSMAFSQFCPSVTIECGQQGDRLGVSQAFEFVERCLGLTTIPKNKLPRHDYDLFHTVAVVKVPEDIEFCFDCQAPNHDINFIKDLDKYNFLELPVGTLLGHIRQGEHPHLFVEDEEGNEVEQSYFALRGNQLVLTKSVMPSMFTLDKNVIRQDCLGYLMERYPLPH